MNGASIPSYGKSQIKEQAMANTVKEVFSYENIKHNVTGSWYKGYLNEFPPVPIPQSVLYCIY
jgi:hypothetical protein